YPKNKKPRPIQRLDKLDTAGLVAALDSPNGTQRDLAQAMLVWEKDEAAVKPLEIMAQTSLRPEARLHALCTLDGLGDLWTSHVQWKLSKSDLFLRKDKHPGVRRHALRIWEKDMKMVSEDMLDPSAIHVDILFSVADDPDVHVQLQWACLLG